MQRRSIAISLLILLSAFLSAVSATYAQATDRIRGAIQGARTVVLAGNRHPLARAEYDVGAAASETRLERMILVLASDATQQQALAALLDAQQDPQSPLYHQWLTPETFATRFGVSHRDVGQIVSWLGAQGFFIDEIPAGGRAIVFSGSAAQVQAAFHTGMHHYRVRGEMHLANTSDPRIPEAFSGIVAGVATLHDFRRPAAHSRLQPVPQYSAGGSYHYLSPGDFATIYDVAPLYAGGITGAGQSIAIVARCNIPMSDVQTFRQQFGLPPNNPTIVLNGPDPGITSGDELSEADLDVQWSGAVAPQAGINFVVSASTQSSDGVDLSAQYIVSHNLAPVMSTSFGLCEAFMGSAERSFYNNLWQQAAAQGITALISSGDSGAAGCDSGSESQATRGPAVNGLCSTPYSVCVGGTEFVEGSSGGQYWSAGNASNGSSALGYIPEAVWNESASTGGSGLWAGGGGASAYYAKPAWQSAPGVPADGQRDVPDVSLTAASHDGYLFYYQGGLYAIAGTSASSPSFAGLMALVNQQTGSRQGNANPIFYSLATLQGSGGLSYFHDTVAGHNTVPGVAGFNAAAGYDLASGLGSVDAAVLVNHWTDATNVAPGFTLSLSSANVTVATGTSRAVTAQVKVAGGFQTAVALSVTGLPPGVTAVFAPSTLASPGSGTSSLTISAGANAAGGVFPIQVVATGGAVTQSVSLSLTVSASACNLIAAPASVILNAGGSAFTQINCGSPQAGFTSSLKLSAGGAPQGVSVSFSPASILPGSAQSKLTITAAATAPAGNYTLTVTANGGGQSPTMLLPVTVNPMPSFTLSLSSASITVLRGAAGQIAVTLAHVGTFNSAIALSVSGQPTGVTTSFSPSSLAAPGDGSSTLTVQAGSTAAAGTHTLTVKAVGGGLTKTFALLVTTQLPPAFTFTAAQKTLTVGQGAVNAVNLTVSGLAGGFNSPVAFSLALTTGGNMPTGLNPSFTPLTIPAPGSGTSLLSFAPASTAVTGAYPLTITASGGGLTRTASITLTVTPPPSFALHAATLTLNALVGGQASTQITSTVVNGFSAPVTLSTGTLPDGIIATFSPSTIAGNNGKSTINLQTTSAAVPGTYTITVGGAGGGVTSALAVTLNVGQLAVTTQSSALTLKHGGTLSVLVSTSVTGSYNSPVALSVTGLPRGVTAAFSPASIANPAAGASTLKLTAASSAALGAQSITIKAVSDGQTITATVTVTVQ